MTPEQILGLLALLADAQLEKQQLRNALQMQGQQLAAAQEKLAEYEKADDDEPDAEPEPAPSPDEPE